MTTAAHPSAPLPYWDRARLVPTRRQLAFVVTMAIVAAFGLKPLTVNPYLEILGETLFVGMVLLFAFTVAGALRQTLLPRWVAQVLSVAMGAGLSPLIVQLLSVGGDFSMFISSAPMVRGYVLVTVSAAIMARCSRSAPSTASAMRRRAPMRFSSHSNVRRCSARRLTRGCT